MEQESCSEGPPNSLSSLPPYQHPSAREAGDIDLTHHWAAPPTTADCEASAGVACYRALQLQQAHNNKKVYAQGLTGAGRTIAVVDSFGSPTIQATYASSTPTFSSPAKGRPRLE